MPHRARTGSLALGLALAVTGRHALAAEPAAPAAPPRSTAAGPSGAPAAGEALAQASEPSLTWVAPEDCIDEAEFRALVSESVRTERLSPTRRVRGEMRRDGAWVVELEVREGGELVGRRRLSIDADRCRAADESLVLVAAMLLEGRLPRGEGLEPSEAAAPEVPEPPEPELAGPPDPPPAPGDRARTPGFHVRVGLGLTATRGLVPGLGWGPGASVSVGQGRFALGVLASYVAPTSSPPASSGGFVRLDAWRVGARACWAPLQAPVELSACGGAAWLSLAGQGVGFDSAESPRWDHVAPEVGLSAGGALLGPLGWFASADLTLLPEQPRFVAEVNGEREMLHEVAMAVGSFGVGLTLTFPRAVPEIDAPKW